MALRGLGAAIVALLLLGLGAWFLLAEDGEAGDVARHSEGVEHPGEEPSADDEAPQATPTAVASLPSAGEDRTPVRVDDIPNEDQLPDLFTEDWDRWIEGRVTVIGPDGTRREDADGELDLGFVDRSVTSVHGFVVRDGRFRIPGTPWTLLSPEVSRLDGRLVFPMDPPLLQVGDDDRIELTYRAPPPLVLQVTAAGTGESLEDVRVFDEDFLDEGLLVDPSWWEKGGAYGDPRWLEQAQIARGPSPLFLQELESPTVLHIRAPGRAWARVEVDPRVGGLVGLSLREACTLTVLLDDPPAHSALILEDLNRVDRDLEPEVRVGPDAENLITGLPPGRWRITLTAYEGIAVDLGSQEVVLTPGVERTLHLPTRPLAPVLPPVEVAGILVVPEGAPPPEGGLLFSGRDWPAQTNQALQVVPSDHLVPVGPGRWAWRTHLIPGPYSWNVLPVHAGGHLEVPPGGTTDLELTLPVLAEVRIEPVFGAEVDEDILWEWAVAADRMDGTLADADETGRARFLAPVGPITVVPYARLYPATAHEFEVHAGDNVLLVPLAAPTGFRVEVVDADSGATVPADVWVEAVHHDGFQDEEPFVPTEGVQLLFVDSPGAYHLRPVPDDDATHRPHAGVVAEAIHGRMVPVRIELTPVPSSGTPGD